MNQLVIRGEDGRLHLPEGMGSGELTTIKGVAVFFDKAGTDVPTVCEEFLRKFEAKPDVQIFLHLRALARPHVADDEKYTVVQTSIADTYRVSATGCHNVVERMVLGLFLWVRENTGTKVAGMRIPVEKLVGVGFVREI
ncbi:hypothetical protein LTS18_002585 [Coniosporium uncinatum]|uniref:Uncharacterized protein n=1 Tax=Coniosporium uncinatum TaxID=93489 RepID=A0ACC3CS55_9PEZI|nr:hypothetical protein LTS18_002585 [Coniosporium uncinatum]